MPQLKIEILQCDDPWMCRNYHTATKSVCCGAPVKQRRTNEPGKRWQDLSPKQQAKSRFEFFCTACKKACDYVEYHRPSRAYPVDNN